MMDEEIQETVESILGKGVVVVDCEKKSSVKEEEVLLVNGCPVSLDGDDGAAIKRAMLRGDVPDCDLLNQILLRAGILRAPVHLETNLSVKSTVVTREEVTVARAGRVVDERSRETKEDNYYTSATSEVWEPVTVVNEPAAAAASATPAPAAATVGHDASAPSTPHRRPPANPARYKETVTTSSKRTEDGVDCGASRPADDFAHTAHVTDGDSLANGVRVIKLNGIHDPRGDYRMPVMAKHGSPADDTICVMCTVFASFGIQRFSYPKAFHFLNDIIGIIMIVAIIKILLKSSTCTSIY
ncbi:uncharacterized protein LOC112688552 [Sipha flava]|uniref:Uncharacterized protein LOC112688552 n=1 Tax=Sipha flava TaxID=143950 RepID=A0A8B8G455_9HEMI|nr:uncharacterized protein LOC112688552 [Sipha flava]